MPNQKKIGFVGKPYSEFIEWLLQHGHEVTCFVEKERTYTFPDGVHKVVPLDFSSKERFLAELQRLPKEPIDAFVGTYENAVLPKTWLCEWYGLPCLPEESAWCATDKKLMRERFQTHCPEISPDFREVETWEDAQDFARNHTFPLMLKPANLFKSLLVTKNDTEEELYENFTKAQAQIQEIYDFEGVKRTPRLLIEEYLEGPSFSVEVFADAQGATRTVPQPVDLVMGRDLGIADNNNYSRTLPSALSSSDQQELLRAAETGVRALGFRSSPAHVELVLTVAGPKIIEIGARTGGYRPRMFRLASGIDLFAAQVEVALGRLPDLQEQFRHFCAVYELFATQEGKFKEASGWEKLLSLPSLYYASVKAKPGKMVGLSRDGYRTAAVIVLANEEQEQFRRDQQYVEEQVAIAVE